MTEQAEPFSKYTTKHPIERALVRNFMRTFDAALPESRPRVIVEVGVGEGMIAERVRTRFPDAIFIVLDLPDDAVARAWKARGLSGIYADAAELPFRDGSVDLILGIEVMEHLPEPEKALSEMARVGRGRALLSVPLEPLWRIGNILRGRYLSGWGNTPDHLQHWGRRSFSAFVSRYFSIDRVLRPLPWTLVVARKGAVPRDT